MPKFFRIKRRDGTSKLVKARPSPSVSRYLYNQRRGVLRSSLSDLSTEALKMFVHNETGKRAFLKSQENGVATFTTAQDSDKLNTQPDHEFFAKHREATPEEYDDEYGPIGEDGSRAKPAPKVAAKT